MYSLDKLETDKDFHVNSIIMELASENADKLTQQECQLHNLQCLIEDEDEVSYTEAAQDIFNIFYDEQVDLLYKAFNELLKIDKK
jgi:hypothetical protein